MSRFSSNYIKLGEYGALKAAGNWRSFNINPRLVADVNGDGKADIVGFISGGIYISLSNGTAFFPGIIWSNQYANTGVTAKTDAEIIIGAAGSSVQPFDISPIAAADVNGDGKADIVGFAGDGIHVSLSNGTAFLPYKVWINDYESELESGGWVPFNIYPRAVVDINGDGKADIVGFAGDGVCASLLQPPTCNPNCT